MIGYCILYSGDRPSGRRLHCNQQQRDDNSLFVKYSRSSVSKHRRCFSVHENRINACESPVEYNSPSHTSRQSNTLRHCAVKIYKHCLFTVRLSQRTALMLCSWIGRLSCQLLDCRGAAFRSSCFFMITRSFVSIQRIGCIDSKCETSDIF